MIKSGIYKINNVITNDFYIGSTVNFKKRKQQHFLALRKNIHHSKFLQRSYNKYGIDKFTMELIEECTEDQLLDKENFYISSLKPKYNYAKAFPYNKNAKLFSDDVKNKMKIIAKERWKNKSVEEKKEIVDFLKSIHPSNTGKVRTNEHRLKISKNMSRPEHKNKLWEIKQQLIKEGKFSYRKVPVIQYDLNGNFIEEWDSIKEAADFLGKNDSGIVNNCKKRNKTAYGFTWAYKNS